jgi:hypothetical protein
VRLPAYRRIGEPQGDRDATADGQGAPLLQSRRTHRLGSAVTRNLPDTQLRPGYPAGDVTGFYKKGGRAGPGGTPAIPLG